MFQVQPRSANFGTSLSTSRSRKPCDGRRILRGRRIGFHQLCERIEIGVDIEVVHLLAHWCLHTKLGSTQPWGGV